MIPALLGLLAARRRTRVCNCAPAYVTGDRTGSITVTQSGIMTSGVVANLVDGAFANGTDDSASFTASPAANAWIQFQFASGTKVTAARWYAGGTSANGIWKWQGSNNGADWTDLSAGFTLQGATTGAVIGDLSNNENGYTYYRMLGVSGSVSGADWHREVEFEQCTC